jgi:hypothetical protein
VTPFSLAWISLACLGLMATALGFVARDVLGGPVGTRDACWLGALFLVTLWAKLLLVEHYPMPVPFWDQWDGEAASLYLPFANDGLAWHQMFTLHNEHRIFFTRVLAMALIAVNGQWDPQLQMYSITAARGTSRVYDAGEIRVILAMPESASIASSLRNGPFYGQP